MELWFTQQSDSTLGLRGALVTNWKGSWRSGSIHEEVEYSRGSRMSAEEKDECQYLRSSSGSMNSSLGTSRGKGNAVSFLVTDIASCPCLSVPVVLIPYIILITVGVLLIVIVRLASLATQSGLQDSSSGITQELVGNAESQAPPWRY
jgi:hypothetical protein